MSPEPNGDRFVVLVNGRRYEGAPGTLDYRTVDFDRYALRIEPRELADRGREFLGRAPIWRGATEDPGRW